MKPGWHVATLSDVLTDARPGFACGEDSADGVFQFRMNNITTEGRLDYSKKRRVPRDTRNIDNFLVEPGDVLFNATNSPELVGKSAFFPGHNEVAVFSNHFLRLRPQADKLDGRFLARWLVLQFQRRVFQGMCRQWVNQATVNRDSLLGLRIPLPPLPEQRRIAEVLDRVEALRSKRRAVLAQLAALTQSIFLDMFGDPATNPKGWPIQRLGDAAKRITKGESPKWQGFGYQDDGALFVTSENVRLGEIDLSEPKFVPLEFNKKLSRSELQRGDLLVNLVGASIGRSCVFPGYHRPANVNQAVGIVTVDESRLEQAYVAGFLVSPHGQRLLLGNRVEAARANISLTDLRKLLLPLPPLQLQRNFSRRVAAVEKLKATHRASLAKLDALFASLQHRAFRGEL